jgi:hypothetical protein
VIPPRPINRARHNGGGNPGGNILRGVFLLARGRAAGIAEFSNTSDGLAASLAPLIAFPLVGASIIAMNGQPKLAIIAFLSRLCGVLALPVITQAFAQLTRREPLWLRTATALNWSFWLLIPLLLVAAFAGAGLVTAGVPQLTAEEIVICLMGAYMLWFHWFTVHTGLKLSLWPATAVVVVTNVVICLLTFGPDLIDQLMQKWRL